MRLIASNRPPATMPILPRRPLAPHQVGKASGLMERWDVRGTPLLKAPVMPIFYRAPTDNDRGGSGGNSYAKR